MRASVHCAHRLVVVRERLRIIIIRAQLRDAAEVCDSAFKSRMSLERV